MSNEPLSLFLVAPKGYEEMTAVIVAPNKMEAKKKMLSRDDVKELVDMGAKLIAIDVSLGLAVQGYNIEISRTCMFH